MVTVTKLTAADDLIWSNQIKLDTFASRIGMRPVAGTVDDGMVPGGCGNETIQPLTSFRGRLLI